MPNEPSLGELFSAVSRDLSALVRSEMELAKAELRDDAKRAAAGGGMIAAALVLALFALGLLSFAIVYGIHAAGLGLAWAFLIVGGGYLLIGALLGGVAVAALRRIRPPERAIRSTRETVTALRTRARAPRVAPRPAPSPASPVGPVAGSGPGAQTAVAPRM